MSSRRPIRRQNRGRTSGARAASFSPLALAPLLWIDSTKTTNTGNGTEATVLLDQSGNGADMVPVTTGPTRRDPTGRRPAYLQFANNVVKTNHAGLIALGNGAAKSRTIVEIGQHISGSTTYRWAWGNTTTASNYIVGRNLSNGYRDSLLVRDASFNNTITQSGLNHMAPCVKFTTFDAAGGTVTIRVDGIDEAPQAISQGTKTIDWFGWGRLPDGAAPTDVSADLMRHWLVFDRVLTLSEKQQIEAWAAPQLGLTWKAGLGATGSTLVVALIGQSNMSGRDPSLYTGNGTATNCWVLFQDGNLGAISEPAWDNTNAWFSQETGGLCSMALRLCERLRALGETRKIIIVPCAKGGTTSTQWAANITQNPPRINVESGFTKHWIDEALKAPGSELVGVIYQGEFDSRATDDPALWSPNWELFQNEFNTRYAAYFVKTKRWFVRQLPATPALTFTNWGTLRTNQATHCSVTRTDSTLLSDAGETYIDGATALHVTQAYEIIMADSTGTAIWTGT